MIAYQPGNCSRPHLLVDHMPHASTVTIGLYVPCGYLWDPVGKWGASHLLEHMLLRGSSRYPDQAALFEALEAAGGSINGYTAMHTQCFYVRTDVRSVRNVAGILFDLVQRPRLDEAWLAAERQVVAMEERKRREFPSLFILDLLSESLGLIPPDAGSVHDLRSLESVAQSDLQGLWHAALTSSDVTCVISGGLSAADASQLLEENWVTTFSQRAQPPAFRGTRSGGPLSVNSQHALTHVICGSLMPGLHTAEWPLVPLLGAIVGARSGRLFRTARSDMGITYDIKATHQLVGHHQVFYMTGSTPDPQVLLGVMEREWAHATELITEDRIAAAKTGVASRHRIAMESTERRMDLAARHWLQGGRVLDPDGASEAVDLVACDQLRAFVEEYLRLEAAAIALLGPVGNACGKVV